MLMSEEGFLFEVINVIEIMNWRDYTKNELCTLKQ